MSIGQDNLPKSFLNGNVLETSDLNKLADVEDIPSDEEVLQFSKEPEVSSILEYFSDNPDEMQEELHKLAKTFLDDNDTDRAWKTLMQI